MLPIKQFFMLHRKEIGLAICLTGMYGASASAVIVTPKAAAEFKSAKNKKEKLLVLLKHYGAPAGLMILSTVGLVSVFMSQSKEISGLVAAAAASERLYTDYKDKVAETLGEKKANDIKDKVAEAIIKDSSVPEKVSNQFIVNNNAEVLCLDTWSGRYFVSTRQKIEDAKNNATSDLFNNPINGTITLNDFYYYLGLEPIQSGDYVGWKAEDGKIELYYSSSLKDGDIPVLAFSFENPPTADFKY